VRQSMGSVGDAYDNALAESWVDSLKTELIADRVWGTGSQLELAVVEYIGWFNHARLHCSLGFIPPAEHEARWYASQHQPLCARTAPAAVEAPTVTLVSTPPRF
jgi:putative transposase